jgi:5-hydroxyisourate hydrolase
MKPTRSPITTHVLDTSRGKPAAQIAVTLEQLAGTSWQELARGVTNADGRVEDWITPGSRAEVGTYRITFDTRAYSPFYPSVSILFQLEHPEQHYHVPLLLNPYGYSTYRGS